MTLATPLHLHHFPNTRMAILFYALTSEVPFIAVSLLSLLSLGSLSSFFLICRLSLLPFVFIYSR